MDFAFVLPSIIVKLNKLDAKLKLGTLLKLKAEVQGLITVEKTNDADEVYDMDWALDVGGVSKFFLKDD